MRMILSLRLLVLGVGFSASFVTLLLLERSVLVQALHSGL
jgi:hypothetical protein